MKTMILAITALLAASAEAQTPPVVNESTGELIQAYEFSLPRARGYYTPRLALAYSSSNKANIGYGYGWTLGVSFIEKDRTTGRYVLSLNGERATLFEYPLGSGNYRPEVERSFLEARITSTSWLPDELGFPRVHWEVTDAVGTKYRFGTARCGLRSYLSSVEDALGNSTALVYDNVRSACAAYLKEVRYNVYSQDPKYATTIVLDYTTGQALPAQVVAGVLHEYDRRLAKVRIKGPSGTTVRGYEAAYDLAPFTGAQRLFSITEVGGSFSDPTPTEVARPASAIRPRTTFVYESGAFSLDPGVTAGWPLAVDVYPDEWVDVDSDGRPDAIWRGKWSGTALDASSAITWARNTTPRGAETPTFDPATLLVDDAPRNNLDLVMRTEVLDFNGDGIMDVVRINTSECTTSKHLQVMLGQRSASGTYSVARATCLDVSDIQTQFATWYPCPGYEPQCSTALPQLTGENIVFADATGDGAMDFAVRKKTTTSCGDGFDAPCEWVVWTADFSAGYWKFVKQSRTLAQAPGGSLSVITPITAPDSDPFYPVSLAVDVNGDGLTDAVRNDNATWSVALNVWGDPGTAYMTDAYPWGDVGGVATHAPLTCLAPDPSDSLGCSRYESVDSFGGECCGSEPSGGEPVDCYVRGERDPNISLGALGDFNGDGVTDYVSSSGCSLDQTCFTISFGTGRSFSSADSQPVENPGLVDGSWQRLYPRLTSGAIRGMDFGYCKYTVFPSGKTGEFVDLNGDGALDYVYATIDTSAGRRLYLYRGRFDIAPPADGAPPDNVPGMLLARVDTPTGARYDIRYELSTAFGELGEFRRPVVVDVSVSGKLVQPLTSRYWYAKPVRAVDWLNPAKYEDRGFSESWTQDSATLSVKHTVWRTDSHALLSSPLSVEVGTANAFAPAPTFGAVTPPSYTTYRKATYSYGLKQLDASVCVSPPSGTIQYPRLSEYPVRVIPTRAEESVLEETRSGDDLWASTITTVQCTDIDANGNALRTEISPSLGGVAGATLITTQTLSTLPTGWMCRNGAPLVTTAKAERAPLGNLETVLLQQVTAFDTSCRPTEQYNWDADAQKKTNRTTMVYGARYGQLSASSAGGVTKLFDYDSQYALYVTAETQDDGTAALTTSYTYDVDTGLRLSASGPRLTRRAGQPYSGPTGVTRYFSYDLFGRPVLTAKRPFEVGDGSIPYVPRVARAFDVVEATEYRDFAAPQAVVSYRFATPWSFSVPSDPAQLSTVLTSDDVMIAVAYADEAGRVVQLRERLGGESGSTEASHVSQPLNGYRVAKSVTYDAAGRVVTDLEPFYDDTPGAGAAFRDYAGTGGLPRLRGTLTSYDARGRPTCVSYQTMEGSLPAPTAGSTCISDSRDESSFALRTEYRYRAVDSNDGVSGLGPYGGSFVVVNTITPELNDQRGSSVAFTKLLGPTGEELGAIDPDGNRVWVQRDALGREIASWRDRQSGSSTPKPSAAGSARSPAIVDAASWIRYNSAGQIVQTWDANAPTLTRDRVYDEAGRLVRLVVDSTKGDGVQYEYGAGGVGRVTRVVEVRGGVVSARELAKNFYDEPYNNESGFCGSADPSMCFIAGKLSWTQNEHTRIAYGYDDAGRVWRRDQVFEQLDGTKRITMSSTYGADGRVLEANIVNGFDATSTMTYGVDYDSAGRPVSVSGGLSGRTSTTYYEAVAQGAQGAYDAAGRIGIINADNVGGAGAKVRSARTFGQWNGLLVAEYKSFLGSGTIFQTSGAHYAGRNLAGYTDQSSGTTYENFYQPSGRLETASARPVSGSTVGDLTQDYIHQYYFDAIGNLAGATSTMNGSAESKAAKRPVREVSETYTPVSPATNQIVDQVHTIATTTYTNGLLTPDGAETTEYEYDLEGHLTRVGRDIGEERLYYGPDGELAYRRVGEKFVFYVGEYATATASGTVGCGSTCIPVPSTISLDAHVVFAGTRIASVNPSRTLYYYRSRLGSVVATSLDGGRLGASYRYSPYGALEVATNETPETASELGYTNALRLTKDLLYLKARVYDAKTRAFVQPDAVDRLRYAYVWGNPVNYSDPTGMLPMANALTPSDAYEDATSAYNQLNDAIAQLAAPVADAAATSTKPPADPRTEQAANPDKIALQTDQDRAEADSDSSGTSRVNASAKALAKVASAVTANSYKRDQLYTDVDSLVIVVDYAARNSDSTDQFVRDLGIVLGGVETNGPLTFERDDGPMVTTFGQTGFLPEFQENGPGFGPNNNQVRHLMAFVAAGYANPFVGTAINFAREYLSVGPTATAADFRLGQAGVALGAALSQGMPRQEAGTWIRRTIEGRTP